jgi:hypothetical protein
MKKIILTVVFFTAATANAKAANLAVITSPPTILSILVFLFACSCLFLCSQVLGLVKGGQMSKSWQMFLLAFTVLAISQIASLLHTFEILAVPGFVVPVLMVLMVGLFLYGMYETKRVLS